MSIPSFSLEGKVAIVTGGGTGIGRGITLEFAKAGADVVVASRRLSVLEKVGEEITVLGKRSLAVQTDISRKTDVDNLVKRAMDEFGGIDILVNNAGIIPRGALLDMPEDEWDGVMNIDLKGYWLCSQAVGKGMVERERGNIINIASTAGLRALATIPAYSIAKAGVVMLTRCLARELASHNIRVNAIAPGLIKVERNVFSWGVPEFTERVDTGATLGRVGEPSQISSVALFLASAASNWVTGQTIVVDGGFLA